MKIADSMVAEFTHEAEGTRKMLERVPEDRLDWKPHQKSMSLGRLATHIAEIPEWAETIVKDDVFNMASVDYKPREFKTRKELLDFFQENVEKLKNRLSGTEDEHLFQSWKLKQGDQVVVDMPRMACLRAFVLSHIIHHRGQLSVYLRENDVPLPGLYGPSADESM